MGRIPGSEWFGKERNLAAVLEQIRDGKSNACLLLEKYVEWTRLSRQKREIKIEGEDKKGRFQRIIQLKLDYRRDTYNRLRQRKNSYAGQFPPFCLQTRSRLVVNLGTESILETSISLHPLYGFPVIPGTAIKGVTRSYVQEQGLANGEWVQWVFGNSHDAKSFQGGNIVFLDAWPRDYVDTSRLNQYLELDVMTPHYPEYYKGNGLPSDDDNPKPIYFLAVKTRVRFEFAIAPSRKARWQEHPDLQRILPAVQEWITEALCNHGLGAKTGSGYGIFGPGT